MRARARRVNKIRTALILSADDFGLSLEVNEAVERAHRQGLLRAASLMVAGPQAHDAIARARRLPSLRVGLHLVLVNGRPLLSPQSVPDLVDEHGCFLTDLGRAGVRFFFWKRARKQLELEIRAQFEAFAVTGLHLDHLNAQNHMHVHPTVLGIVLKVGAQYGMEAVRIPREPFFASWRATRDHFGLRLSTAILLWPWLTLMKQRLKRAGLLTNDFVFGMNDSGRMLAPRVRGILAHLPPGISELYFHPAIGPWPGIDPAIAGYCFAGELAALTAAEVAQTVRSLGIGLTSFGELRERDAG